MGINRRVVLESPQVCEHCQHDCGPAVFDAKIADDTWRYLCPSCFTTLQCKLGPGRGYRYSLYESGLYVRKQMKERRK